MELSVYTGNEKAVDWPEVGERSSHASTATPSVAAATSWLPVCDTLGARSVAAGPRVHEASLHTED